MREIRRLRIEAFCDVAFGDTRRTVANGAMRGEMLRAVQKIVGIAEPGWRLDAGGVSFNRAGADCLENPARYWPMRIARSNVEKTRINKGEPANGDDSNRDGERDKKSAHLSALRARCERQRQSGNRRCSRLTVGRNWRTGQTCPRRRRRDRARIFG